MNKNYIKKYKEILEKEYQLSHAPRWAPVNVLKNHGFNCKIAHQPVFLHLDEACAVKTLTAPTIDLLISKLKEECPNHRFLYLLYPPKNEIETKANGLYKIRYHLISEEDHQKSLKSLVTLGKTTLDNNFTLNQAFDLNIETVNTLMGYEGEEATIQLIGQAVIEAIKREVNVHETHSN